MRSRNSTNARRRFNLSFTFPYPFLWGQVWGPTYLMNCWRQAPTRTNPAHWLMKVNKMFYAAERQRDLGAANNTSAMLLPQFENLAFHQCPSIKGMLSETSRWPWGKHLFLAATADWTGVRLWKSLSSTNLVELHFGEHGWTCFEDVYFDAGGSWSPGRKYLRRWLDALRKEMLDGSAVQVTHTSSYDDELSTLAAFTCLGDAAASALPVEGPRRASAQVHLILFYIDGCFDGAHALYCRHAFLRLTTTKQSSHCQPSIATDNASLAVESMFLANNISAHASQLYAPRHLPVRRTAFRNLDARESADRRRTDLDRGLLTFRLAGGLTNQRIRLKHGLLAGYLTKKAIVLPDHVQTRTHYDAAWSGAHAGWHQVAFASLFDVPHLSACCARMGVRVHATAPPGEEWSEVETVRQLLEQPLAGPRNARLGRSPYIPHPRPLAAADALDKCIRYADDLRARAAAIEAQLRGVAGPRRVIGLHLRLEDDALAFFGAAAASFPQLLLNNSVACISAAPGTASGALVFVATGLALDSDPMRALSRTLPFEVVHRHQFSGSTASPWQDDVGASIDQMVLATLDYFVGFAPSTFSIEVAQQRRKQGKTSTLVGPCDFSKATYAHCALANCSPFPAFTGW